MDKEQIIKKLQGNVETISNILLPQALNKGKEIKYKNYINALSSTLELIDKYSWQTMWSKYRDGNGKQFVSIWEQDINGNIKDNCVFAVDENYNLTMYGHFFEEKISVSNVDISKDKISASVKEICVPNDLKVSGYKSVENENQFRKYIKTSEIMIDLFNNVKETKNSQIIYTDENMRNIGKTYSLYTILKNNENTILLTKTTRLFLKNYDDIESSRVFSNVDNIKGIDRAKIVLIDESISKNEFEKLDRILYCGYRHINTL